MGSLLGSKGNKGQQTSSGGTIATGTSSQGSSSSSQGSNQSQSSTTPGFIEELSNILKQTQEGTTGFTKQDAINDVGGVLRAQATDALQSVMPSIARTQTGAGAYNSTTKELMQNDANARITSQLAKTAADTIAQYQQIQQGNIGAFADATKAGTSQQSSSTGQQSAIANSFGTSQNNTNSWNNGQQSSSGGGSGLLGLFADGGEVPKMGGTGNDTMEEFLDRFVAQTGLGELLTQASATAENPSVRSMNSTVKASEKINKGMDTKLDDFLIDSALSLFGFADGGQVPGGQTNPLQAAIERYRAGGTVRTGTSDVEAGGKIRGPQTKDGEDNQLIAVGGGEGILAADVMEVPGVAELVKSLNDRFHTPTNK